MPVTDDGQDAPRVLRAFSPPNLLQIAMPMGGIGAGCICLNGYGGIQDLSIRNHPDTSALPDGHSESDAAFALVHIHEGHGAPAQTRLLEGPLPPEKVYDQGLKGQGGRQGGHEGLPRFAECRFDAGYPFGIVHLTDPSLPIAVAITGWSPFIPGDDVHSGMPMAILEYCFHNRSNRPVTFEFSYHLSHLALGAGARRWSITRNAVIGVPPDAESLGGGIHFTNTTLPTTEESASAALYAVGWQPRVKAMWLRGGWFDGITALWREVSGGRFTENDGSTPVDDRNSRNGGSILGSATLAPGESVTFPVLIAWHFPNPQLTVGLAAATPACDCGPGGCDPVAPAAPWHPFYAGVWKDARAVVLHAAERYMALRSRTVAFQRALLGSTLPAPVLDAVSSNLAILKSPTVLRQQNGNVWAWEGCFPGSGCCSGSCTHVWNYAQALPNLFPALERTLREQELDRSMDDRGHINFRSALPDGPTTHDFHAAADGQLGGILKLYRDYHICGDRDWLERLYSAARRSLEFCISTWDPDRRGGLFEPHHNTYDIEFWGPDGMCGTIYAAALSAQARLAETLGRAEDAAEYDALAHKAAAFLSAELFNGEYYQQRVRWEGLRATSFAERMAKADPDSCSDRMRILLSEGPPYQYGAGCLSDGVIGAWMARIYGVDAPLDREQVRATLEAIHRHNFRVDLASHPCTQRPGYAMGHEPGLFLCTWPRGDKPTLPFVYSDEVWTGIEYQVASHLIEEGMATAGLEIVAAARSRYEGHVRNPFNEYECGSYYARALASYALLGSLSGFCYSAAERTLHFAPYTDQRPFECFFSAASGFGTIRLDERALHVALIEGELAIDTLILGRDGAAQTISWGIVATSGAPAIKELS
jgi:uncharacterized protein (DUF608 family)